MKLIPLLALTGAMTLGSSAGFAEETKAQSCAHQANVVAAVQQARKDRVRERDVMSVITARANPWPARYNAAIPMIAGWVYEQKRRTIRREDLGAAWNELCLAR